MGMSVTNCFNPINHGLDFNGEFYANLNFKISAGFKIRFK